MIEINYDTYIAADALVSTGLARLGYNYVNIGDLIISLILINLFIYYNRIHKKTPSLHLIINQQIKF